MATSKKGASTKSEKGSQGKSGGGGRENSAFMKPVQPSAELSAVIGNSAMPRTEITKKVWDYIKKNNLQDSQNKRMINADDKLRPIFGG